MLRDLDRPGVGIDTGTSNEVALLDRDGVIVAVNRAWDEFCRANGGEPARCGVGLSYLEVCDQAGDAATIDLAAAIRRALRGEAIVAARVRVPCHSPGTRRWYDVLVSTRCDERGDSVGATVVLCPAEAHSDEADETGSVGPLLRVAGLVGDELTLDGLAERVVGAALALTGCQYASVRLAGDDEAISHFVEVRSGSDPPPEQFRCAFPIAVGDRPVGELVVADADSDGLTEAAMALASRLAAVAGTAVSNTMLFQTAERQRHRLVLAEEMTAELVGEREVDPVRLVVDRVAAVVEADVVTVLLPAEDGSIRVRAAVGVLSDQLMDRSFDGQTIYASRVLQTGRPTRRDGPPPGGWVLSEAGPAAFAPLIGRDGPIGVLSVARLAGQPPFTAIEVEHMVEYARFAGLALEMAQGRLAEQELRIEKERHRIAFVLNDDIVRRLFATSLTLASALKSITDEHAHDSVASSIAALDAVRVSLRDAVLPPDGLPLRHN